MRQNNMDWFRWLMTSKSQDFMNQRLEQEILGVQNFLIACSN